MRDLESGDRGEERHGGDGLVRDGVDLEEQQLGTDPANPDSDGDGIPDGLEVHGPAREFPVCTTSPLTADFDGDGLADGTEVHGVRIAATLMLANGSTPVRRVRTNPCASDTDGDGVADGDGLRDRAEVTGSRNRRYGSAPTDPLDWDTDTGGISDGVEVAAHSNPADAASWPGHLRVAVRSVTSLVGRLVP